MKKKLFVATVVALCGALLQAADPVGRENVAPPPKEVPVRDVTKEVLNRMNIPRQERPAPSASSATTADVLQREMILGL